MGNKPQRREQRQSSHEELIADNFYGPYDLILQPSAFLAAHTFIGNTAVMQIDKIKELIAGKVYVTPVDSMTTLASNHSSLEMNDCMPSSVLGNLSSATIFLESSIMAN